jgi:hypothetical protein
MLDGIEKFTRQQLYELVWSTPVQQLAPLFNLSDVGFAKLCRRYLIPLPPRGYWRRKEFGYKVKQPPLPKWSDEREPLIHLSRTEKPRKLVDNPNEEIELQAENRIVVPRELSEKLHLFVRRTASVLRRSKTGQDGRLTGRDERAFVVQVSRAELDRSLRILQSFTEACEKRGFELNEGTPNGGGVSLVVAGQRIHFVVEERLRRVRHELTRAEQLALQRPYPPRDIRKWDYEPDGVLVLKLVGLPWNDGPRLWWADTQKEKLEERLNDVMAVLPVVAERLRLHHEEVERKRLERQAEELRRAAERSRQEVLVARFRFIEAQAHLWERHQRLRGFVADVKRRLGEERWTDRERASGEAWVSWAENYLASRDAAALLFFNPLLTEGDQLFPHYRYTMPAWGQPADAWLATWEPRVGSYY